MHGLSMGYLVFNKNRGRLVVDGGGKRSRLIKSRLPQSRTNTSDTKDCFNRKAQWSLTFNCGVMLGGREGGGRSDGYGIRRVGDGTGKERVGLGSWIAW